MRFRPGLEVYSELFTVKCRMPLVMLVAARLRSCASPCRAEICRAIRRDDQRVVAAVFVLAKCSYSDSDMWRSYNCP